MRRVLGSIILISLVPLILACVVEAFSFIATNFVPLLLNWLTYGFILFFLGLTLAFHFAALFKEFSPRQPDIYRTGASLSLFAIIPLNAFFTVLTISFAVGIYAYPIDYCKRIFMTAIRTYQFIGQLFINPSKVGP